MNKKTIKDINGENKRYLIRTDFNVPIIDGAITDDKRIKESLPTIKYALSQKGASVVLMSHLGRPEGKPDQKYSLKPVAVKLSELLGVNVVMLNDSIGKEVESACKSPKAGSVILLENLRFHAEETEKDSSKREGFAKELAKNGDIYVNDAFGTAHREHASTATITKFMTDSVAGFLMEKELDFLGRVITVPERPFVFIIGGFKVSDKIGVIENIIDKADRILIGGAMRFTFLKAKGINVGRSPVEESMLDKARSLMDQAARLGKELLLPVDAVVAKNFDDADNARIIMNSDFTDDIEGFDIGPKSTAMFSEKVKDAKTVFWNGPMGAFEVDAFENGTLGLARAIASNKKCVSVIGGGDSAAAIHKLGLDEEFTHISTGGGASLEFIEGKKLPGVIMLDDK